jgi:hypothetical protein
MKILTVQLEVEGEELLGKMDSQLAYFPDFPMYTATLLRIAHI